MRDYIYGIHAVEALLTSAPERIETLYLAQSAESQFRPLAAQKGVHVEPLPKNQFMRDLQGVVHQGVVAKVSLDKLLLEYTPFMDALELTPETALVLLNEITDPHNVGAIIRSAAAFGAAAVLIPTFNQAGVTGVVAKASAGTVFSVPLVAIGNENQTILDLKKRHFWTYGLAAEGDHELAKETFDAPAVFVIGSEGEGLRQKTREHCDILLRIPMHPRAESLNASVSAGVALAAWATQHPRALAAG